MTEPFIGEVQILGFGFAPRGWALAAGQLIPLRQSVALYSLYGIQFGGDGTTTFGLPNLAARMACGAGQSPGNSNRTIGQIFGTSSVALTAAQMPPHTHAISDYQPGDTSQLSAGPTAGGAVGYAANQGFNAFAAPGAATTMDPNALGIAGNGDPHENRQPFLGLVYAVALVGAFPSFN